MLNYSAITKIFEIKYLLRTMIDLDRVRARLVRNGYRHQIVCTREGRERYMDAVLRGEVEPRSGWTEISDVLAFRNAEDAVAERLISC